MDRGLWWPTVHGFAELETTEHIHTHTHTHTYEKGRSESGEQPEVSVKTLESDVFGL